MAFKRWLYPDGHPNLLAKILNRGWAMVHSTGISPQYPGHVGSGGETIGENDQFSAGDDGAERGEISGVNAGRGYELGAKRPGCFRKSQAAARDQRASTPGRGGRQAKSTHLEGVFTTCTRSAAAHIDRQGCAGFGVRSNNGGVSGIQTGKNGIGDSSQPFLRSPNSKLQN